MADNVKKYTGLREMYPALFASLDKEIRGYIAQIDTESLLWGNPLGGFDSPFIGPVQEVAPPPPPEVEPRLCACGAELMGSRAKATRVCGDCAAPPRIQPPASLDQRIAEAQPPKVDKDPTAAWSAGQTPGYEWP